MTSAKFAKGQTVFQACINFACKDGVRIGVVIERMLDSAGKKFVTFYDRADLDSVFGRRERIEYAAIFATQQEAFQHLQNSASTGAICKTVYTDSNDESFRDFRSGAMALELK